jgi:hypothetical protein
LALFLGAIPGVRGDGEGKNITGKSTIGRTSLSIRKAIAEAPIAGLA